jgi:transcriptional regulator with XRE-family HTH domain
MKMSEDKNKLIGQKIKEAREAAEKSQKELADALGFESATAISLIESGERKAKIEDLVKMADFLHRDVKFFLGMEEKTDIRFALRADKDLSATDQKQILRFIDFVKKEKDGGTK